MDGPQLGVLHHHEMELAAFALLCHEHLTDHGMHTCEARKRGGTRVKDSNGGGTKRYSQRGFAYPLVKPLVLNVQCQLTTSWERIEFRG